MDQQTIARVKKAVYNPDIGPETIALMLTSICNFNCIYCRGGRIAESTSSHTHNITEELSTEELFELLDDARAFHVQEINLGGMNGEPFCKKDIIKIMHKIKQLEFCGSMTTNGSFLNAHIARQMDDCGWNILLISLDSPEASFQHMLRPALNRALYFDNIIEFLDTLESSNSKLRVLLNMVITRLNYRALPQMVKFANCYKNVESINILKLIDMCLPTYNELQLTNDELREFQSMLMHLRDEKKITYASNWVIDTGTQQRTHKRREGNYQAHSSLCSNGCFTNYYILSIDANGDILQCPQHQKIVEGLNIRKIPLRQLWKNEHLQFRKNLAHHATCFEECCTILKEQNKMIMKEIVKYKQIFV